ncbi:MAG: hypothetical protein V1907_04520 [Candidatus Kerfeldbacteria bacterium]
MAPSFYRKNILSKAWALAWYNKGLWFFGLFAALLAIGEEYDVLIRNGDILESIPRRLENFRIAAANDIFSGFTSSLSNFISTNIPGTLYILVTWIIAILALAWLVIVAQGALIEGAKRREEGKPLNVIEGFDVGMANFWPIFLVNVIAKVVVYGLLILVGLPAVLIYMNTASVSAALVLMLWSFLILFPVMVIVSFITKFANAYIVIKKYPVKQAITSAWNLFTRNILVTLELAALLVLIKTIVVYMAVSTLINALGFPQFSTGEYIFFIVILGFIYSWLTTFQFGSWTYLFFELEGGTASSKLRRIIHYVLDVRESPAKPAPARTVKR